MLERHKRMRHGGRSLHNPEGTWRRAYLGPYIKFDIHRAFRNGGFDRGVSQHRVLISVCFRSYKLFRSR